MNATDRFLEYLRQKNAEPLPEAAALQAKQCLLDFICVACAGVKSASGSMDAYISRAAGGEVPLIGLDRKADPLSAAFINGFHAHVMELDDGHRFGMIHLGAPVIPAVLSAAQMSGASGEKLLRGIVLGYEAAVRLGISLQPTHKVRGFHTTGTCGTMGAAVGTSVVLGLSLSQMKTAVSAAGTGLAGLLEIQEERSELKPYNAAQAAMVGLNAALLGLTGLPTPDDILGGPRGVGKALGERCNVEKLVQQTDYFEIQRIYRKPYAACRHCHSAIEAAIRLRDSIGVSPEQVRELLVRTYKLAIRGHDHKNIQGVASAKLSIPYSVAAAYTLRDCGMQAFRPELVSDEALLALTQKVRTEEDGEFTACSPAKRIAEVILTDLAGNTYTTRVDYAKGDPENPMTDRELREKYDGLMAYAERTRQAGEIWKIVERIEQDADALYGLL